MLLTGCTNSIDEITSTNDYLGKEVAVKGTVEAPLKIGKISGYTLVDVNGDKIIVGSESLPAEGSTVTAKGTLEQGPLGMGYFINTNN